MQTYIPKICSIFLLTNRCSNSKIQLHKQMFATSVRGIYNTDLQLMIQGGTVMRNESNTITGRTRQISGNTSSRIHSGDVSRNRRIVVRRQKIALVSVAFIALAIIICTFLTLTNGFKLFDQNLALTNGAPNRETAMMALDIYNTFYGSEGQQGVGQAKAVIFFIIVAIIALAQNKITTSKEVQD